MSLTSKERQQIEKFGKGYQRSTANPDKWIKGSKSFTFSESGGSVNVGGGLPINTPGAFKKSIKL